MQVRDDGYIVTWMTADSHNKRYEWFSTLAEATQWYEDQRKRYSVVRLYDVTLLRLFDDAS